MNGDRSRNGEALQFGAADSFESNAGVGRGTGFRRLMQGASMPRVGMQGSNGNLGMSLR